MNQSKPIQAVFHYPKDPKFLQMLYCQIADLQTEYVLAVLSQKNFPAEQKLALLDAVIDTSKNTHLGQHSS